VNEIKLNHAKDNLQKKLELLNDMETAFKRFTAAGQSEGARELRGLEFRESCNDQGDKPYQIFRTLYGHGCSDCDALEGGGRDLNFFICVLRKEETGWIASMVAQASSFAAPLAGRADEKKEDLL